MKAHFVPRTRSSNTLNQSFSFRDKPSQIKDRPFQKCRHLEFAEHYHPTISQIAFLNNKIRNKLEIEDKYNKSIFQSSRITKAIDMKGQLETHGTAFFLRDASQPPSKFSKLIPSDCSIFHTCYDTFSKDQRMVNCDRNRYASQLKYHYDQSHIVHEPVNAKTSKVWIFTSLEAKRSINKI